MLARGITVSGSDAKESRTVEALRALGARCYVGHDASHVQDADTLVISTAVREDNPEVVEAQRRGLRLLPRSAALDSVMQGRRVVAVARGPRKSPTTPPGTPSPPPRARGAPVRARGGRHETGFRPHAG